MAGKNVEMKFELDYWGLSNKQAFEYILQNDSKNKILIGSASTNILERSKQILKKSDRNRILPSENINADYIIDNYRILLLVYYFGSLGLYYLKFRKRHI